MQGLSTPFFARLADQIAARGHKVERINLSGGDKVFWPRLGAVNYRGRFTDWRSFLGGFLHERGVSDVILFGDCRPYHRVAVDLARSRGIAVHVFEEGYFRPDWITLEHDGTNGHSRLPREREAYLAEAAAIEGSEITPRAVSGGISRRVRWEMLNQIATMLLAPLYPHYRRHRSHHPLTEMCGWLKRLAKRPFERRYAARLSKYLESERPSYFLLPLQLETDYQIRRHSRFKSMAHVMEVTLESFARGAPRNSLLVVKLHPLDNGIANFRKQARRIARRLKLDNRVLVMDGGHLPTLLSRCKGVVVVNSTTGLSALHHGRPVTVLGSAIFDLHGLTFKGSFDRFWKWAKAPDPELFRAFRRVVLTKAQVNGSFFTFEGLDLAVEGTLKRLAVTPVPQAAAQARPSVAPALAPAKDPILIR
ncbi:MAG: capsular biosynthesis protein [Pseudomonadota bacterium]|nr:capsular biosynthesis protein [Pseudomonadota bacterium]